MPPRRRRWLKPAVFTGALVPLAAILWNAARGNLGANPIAEALNELGLTALVFLLLSLAATPLRENFDWPWAVGLRRMLGLFAFFYALLHAATYAFLDQGGKLSRIFADVTKRPFIFAGFAAFLILIPLAATSTAASVRRLGFPRWKRLHRLVYLAGGLGVLHFLLRVKKDVTEPVVYIAILAVFLLARVVLFWRKRIASGRVRGLEQS